MGCPMPNPRLSAPPPLPIDDTAYWLDRAATKSRPIAEGMRRRQTGSRCWRLRRGYKTLLAKQRTRPVDGLVYLTVIAMAFLFNHL
jgi:hypothetical protein